MNCYLLGSPRCLGLGFGCSSPGRQGLTVIFVHRIGLFLALTFRWVDPADSNLLLALRKILAVPLVSVVGRKFLQVINTELLISSIELRRPLFAVLQDCIDIVVGQVCFALQ